ncbi:MAG: DUF1707 domain-containing protein [Streptosporangiaceae bacterium]|jgi:hypothetical protein
MTDPQDPNAPVELRASDADREQVADRLREAAADGRITMDELEERLETAYTSMTHAELRPLTRDLAVSDTPASAPAARERVAVTPGRRRRSIVVMSGLNRRGRWVVPARFSVFAFWGGVQLDLRQASLTAHETVIRADAVMAGIEIIVPDDVAVQVEGVGFMGAFDETPSTAPPPPDAPVIRITGIAFWAGIAVKRTPRYTPKQRRDELTT